MGLEGWGQAVQPPAQNHWLPFTSIRGPYTSSSDSQIQNLTFGGLMTLGETPTQSRMQF